ncbi:MAG: hypothetical protein K0R57_4831 [Paenibacillaceae bacterium]|jgi:putative SOS response-associated peptidase YedK|nr:hypothetical protein [Paenibacillaceae bacterium]
MCGRFTLAATLEELMNYIAFSEHPEGLEAIQRYNLAPGQLAPAVISLRGVMRMGMLQWGLIPSWVKEARPGSPPINAKAETLMDKPTFREPFQHKRCLILADSYYEWRTMPDGSKQPMRIMLKNRSIFAMAGLYDTWTSPDGTKVSTCAVITTTPNKLTGEIHHRMPVILRQEDHGLWLDREHFDQALLQALLVPYPAEEMEAYPVSPAVGRVQNDGPELIIPFIRPEQEAPPEQQQLF